MTASCSAFILLSQPANSICLPLRRLTITKLLFFRCGILPYYYVRFAQVQRPLCVTSALCGAVQTGGQRCSCSNTLASGSKHTVCFRSLQQMAVFNYARCSSVIFLSYSPPSLYLFHFFPLLLQVLRNRDFQSCSAAVCVTLCGFCVIDVIEAVFWFWDVLIYADLWTKLCPKYKYINIKLQGKAFPVWPLSWYLLKSNAFFPALSSLKRQSSCSIKLVPCSSWC